jgi:hypothetical protein
MEKLLDKTMNDLGLVKDYGELIISAALVCYGLLYEYLIKECNEE